MESKGEQSQTRIRTTFEPHQLSLVKHKSIDGADRQYRHAELLAQSHSIQARQNCILEVRQTSEEDGTYAYSMERVTGGSTLRQYMRSEEFKRMSEEGRVDQLYKLMPAVVRASRYLKQQYPQEDFVVSPQMIVFQQQTAKLSVVALQQQSPSYQPLYAGISKENSTVWSLAMICDELLRGGEENSPFNNEKDKKKEYEPPSIKDPNIIEFLMRVLGENQTLSFEQLEQLFEHPKDQLICSAHFKKVVKVDTENNMLLCQECLKEQFYEWEFEKAECRKSLDYTIDFYKDSYKHFERLITFAKGEQTLSKEIEQGLESLLEHFKAEYNEHLSNLRWRKLSVVEQSQEIERTVQSLSEFKDALRDKYVRKMKKLICDWVRSEILK